MPNANDIKRVSSLTVYLCYRPIWLSFRNYTTCWIAWKLKEMDENKVESWLMTPKRSQKHNWHNLSYMYISHIIWYILLHFSFVLKGKQFNARHQFIFWMNVGQEHNTRDWEHINRFLSVSLLYQVVHFPIQFGYQLKFYWPHWDEKELGKTMSGDYLVRRAWAQYR